MQQLLLLEIICDLFFVTLHAMALLSTLYYDIK